MADPAAKIGLDNVYARVETIDMFTSLTDPGLASPASSYDEPTPCPECGIGDAEYGLHEADCPSGGDGLDIDALQDSYREAEDESGHVR